MNLATGRTRNRATAVVIRDGKVLLVNSGRRPEFMMPGGLIEPGESPESAAVRELFEETGLTARRTEFLFVVETSSHRHRVSNRHHVFLIEADGEVDIQSSDGEIASWLWWDREEGVHMFGHVGAILERL